MTNFSQSAFVCVIDRLGAGWIGPYGNTWVETPAFNQLATECVLFEQAFADSPDLSRLYRSYWAGQHALCVEASPATNLIGDLTRHGVDTILVTDEPFVAEHPLSDAFGRRIEIAPPISTESANGTLDTHFAQLFSAALGTLPELKPPFLLWMHSRGMEAPWDAPYCVRESFAAEDDPFPPDFTAVPSCQLPVDFDPDELLGMVQAYAGQVVSVDECLAGLLTAISDYDDTPLLTILTSPRGFPLGEHRVVGNHCPVLYSETLHVPYLLRYPRGQHALRRIQRTIQPADLSATLAEWYQLSMTETQCMARSSLQVATGTTGRLDDRACAVHDNQRVFRTPAWQLKVQGTFKEGEKVASGDMISVELFTKPDDRLEVNNVFERCPEIVREMYKAAIEYEMAAANSDVQQLGDLPDVLVHGLD